MTDIQRKSQLLFAQFLVDHYKLTPLERRMQLLEMDRIVDLNRGIQTYGDIDYLLDDPRRGQADFINEKR